MSITESTVRPDPRSDPESPPVARPPGVATADGPDTVRRFLEVRSLTDALAERLSPEDQTPQSMTEASPAKWHRAHVTWFFEEFILRQNPDYVVYDETFRYLFNSYYETVGERHPRPPDRGLVTRPGVRDVTRYREHVDAAMVEALEAGRFDDAALELVELGCNHEQQHQELLLMDIKHLFSTHAFGPVYVDRERRARAVRAARLAGVLRWGCTRSALSEVDSPTTTRAPPATGSTSRTSRCPIGW